MKSMKVKKLKTAKAVQYDEEEAQDIIRGKLRDRIHRQEEFCKLYHARVYKQEELDYMEYCMKEGSGSTDKLVVYLSILYPLKMFEARIKYEYFNNYRPIVERELSLKQALKNDGLTDAELEECIKGKFKKEFTDVKPEKGVVEKHDSETN